MPFPYSLPSSFPSSSGDGLTAYFSVSVNKGVITFTDGSTANYGGETITSRKLVITLADGAEEELDWPLINGVGDTITYETAKDIAFTGEIILTPDSIDPTSTYSFSENILSAGFTYVCLMNARRKSILEYDPKNILTAPQEPIDTIEKISSFYDAALNFMANNELTSAQEAIDLAFALCQYSKCNCP